MSRTIVSLPGDGIGKTVLPEAIRVLDAAGFKAEYIHGDIGWEFWCKEGNALPQRTIDLLEEHKIGLFGAITSKPKDAAAKEKELFKLAKRQTKESMKMIDEQAPAELDLHLIVDNYATHKHEKVKRWLKRHPRFHMHFIPTSSSWLNIVEGFFRNLDQKRLKRDAFRSVPELIRAIMEYIENHNDDPTPIVWTKAADEILEKVGRARAALKMPPLGASHH